MSEGAAFRSGFIAIVGRPNVGKSTLLNHLVGQKISITSRKAQTTRHSIAGILTDERSQFVFVDTPGFQTKHKNALNQSMNRVVATSMRDVHAVLFVIEAGYYDERDRQLLRLLPEDVPVILVVNKMDCIASKNEVLPFIDKIGKEREFAAIVPVSAKQGKLDTLLEVVRSYLPEGELLYAADEITNRNERFLAAELLREKIFRLTGEELPYSASVQIEQFKEEKSGMRRIHAAILVDKEAHKAMLIGKDGAKLKEIATKARLDMEKMFGAKVFLEVFVKIRRGWADKEHMLKSLGYE